MKPCIAVAGHICLDIAPLFPEGGGQLDLAPGRLLKVGAARLSTGGAVANTGVALHRLGAPVRLLGKVGDDLFGRAILDIVRRQSPRLASGMIVARGEASSYSVVINPPGRDRTFLHCPGANDTFVARDVPEAKLSGIRLLHFGYPSLMRRTYAAGGRELAALFSRAKRRGIATSLDLAWPDQASEAGRADWRALLRRWMPLTDVFLPSLEEILFMLDRRRFERLDRAAGAAGVIARVDGRLLDDLAAELLAMGAAVVVIKLGTEGIYLRTGGAARLAAMGAAAPAGLESWAGRELLAPCFEVKAGGTTAAGDCAIAGFLAGLLRGLAPGEALAAAAGAGALCVEGGRGAAGLPRWSVLVRRIRSGWKRRPSRVRL